MTLTPPLAGTRITASLMAELFPVSAVKPADGAAIVSNVTLANDTDLVLTLKAGFTYKVTGELVITGAASGSGGLALAFTFPAGASFSWGSWGLAVAGGANVNAVRNTSGTSSPFGTSGATLVPCFVEGTCVVGASDITLQAQVAQSVSSATGTVVKVNSWLKAEII